MMMVVGGKGLTHPRGKVGSGQKSGLSLLVLVPLRVPDTNEPRFLGATACFVYVRIINLYPFVCLTLPTLFSCFLGLKYTICLQGLVSDAALGT